MARIFLDANIFIDLIEERGTISFDKLHGNELYISPLSLHILLYIAKIKLPSSKISKLIKLFVIIPLDEAISYKAVEGPLADFEDNLQLHSAAASECDYFLTNDNNLLDLRFFGKTKIVNSV